jgi:hypothetical protein
VAGMVAVSRPPPSGAEAGHRVLAHRPARHRPNSLLVEVRAVDDRGVARVDVVAGAPQVRELSVERCGDDGEGLRGDDHIGASAAHDRVREGVEARVAVGVLAAVVVLNVRDAPGGEGARVQLLGEEAAGAPAAHDAGGGGVDAEREVKRRQLRHEARDARRELQASR